MTWKRITAVDYKCETPSGKVSLRHITTSPFSRGHWWLNTCQIDGKLRDYDSLGEAFRASVALHGITPGGLE